MRLDLHQSQRLEQTMRLAPRMIQSMEILQLPVMALQERIQQELQENPVLELKEAGDESAGEENEEVADADAVTTPEPEPTVEDDPDFERFEAMARDWDEQFAGHRASRNGMEDEADKKHDAMQNMPSRPQSLQEYLNDQLAFLDIPPEQLKIVRYLISNLDDRGYLSPAQSMDRTPSGIVEDLARSYETPLGAAEVEEALKILQRLEPAGVGARTLDECLLLQLTPETPHREVLQTLIANHLEDIEHNRLPIIQRRTGFEITVIKEAIETLKHLNPRPGAPFHAENIPYVVPDILVERTDNGDYDVRLVDDWVPNIYVSRRYIELYREKGADPKAREYLKRKIQAAQWLLEAIEQRRGTLEKVTRAIIQHQKAFLDKGPENIEPLKMQQIADQVGVHVTTVSRAVDEKWVQTPRGIFSLKRFFGGGTHTATGEEVAWETIKQKLLEIIATEDKSNPLSDEDLVNKLSEAGYPVARRTVTKYRKMLNIPSSRQRKDWTA